MAAISGDLLQEPGDLFRSTINEYLENLPEAVHTQLYQSPETCLAIFRLLPSLAKFYIMTLLFQDTPVRSVDLNRWIKQPHSTGIAEGSDSLPSHRNANKIYQNESIHRLKALNLLKETRKQATNPATGKTAVLVAVHLNKTFRDSFRRAIAGSKLIDDIDIDSEEATPVPEALSKTTGESNELSNMFEEEEKINIPFLDKYCLNKWENILHFMVGSQIRDYPSIDVLRLLRFAHLMELPSDREKRETLDADYDPDFEEGRLSLDTLKKLLITNHGFQFLLQPINSQIWAILLQYLKLSENSNMNPVDVLNFIFMLGSLELGEGYPIRMLSKTQILMLKDLVDYGLIYEPGSKTKDPNGKFYPTRLATTLTSETTSFQTPSAIMNQEIGNAKDSTSEGSIILETNFKLYCYTSSPLQIAILNLFVHLKARFQNMVTGSLTRESVRSALTNGITADQIIKYLETHAHPGMAKLAEEKLSKKLEFETSLGNTAAVNALKLEILPPTVIDQVKLWQLELDRIQSFKGYLYMDFANDLEYEKLLNYGEEIGVVLWKDNVKRKFFVTAEGNSQLIEYTNRILRRGSNTPRQGTPA